MAAVEDVDEGNYFVVDNCLMGNVQVRHHQVEMVHLVNTVDPHADKLGVDVEADYIDWVDADNLHYLARLVVY